LEKLFLLMKIKEKIPLKCDFHVHYIELMSDKPETMIDMHYELNYDCIVLTEHDQYLDPELQRRLMKYANDKYGNKLLVGFGEELTFWEDHARGVNGGDILGLFTKSKINYEKHHKPERSIREIRKQGGLVISAHDTHSNAKTGTAGIWGIRNELAIDGFEIINGGKINMKDDSGLTHPNEAVSEGFICLANTDAHNTEQLKKASHVYTMVYAEKRSLMAVRKALELRQTVAVYGNHYFGTEEWVRQYQKSQFA
jgi:hypothetical protein